MYDHKSSPLNICMLISAFSMLCSWQSVKYLCDYRVVIYFVCILDELFHLFLLCVITFQSFCLSFLTQLDRASHPLVEQLVCKHVIGRSNIKGILKQPIPPPAAGHYIKVEGYWIAQGDKEANKPRDYILTESVKANLRDLARIVSAGYENTYLSEYLSTIIPKLCKLNWIHT